MVPIISWLPVTLSTVGTGLALIAFSYQVHRARFNQSVDLLFRLEADFFGPAKIKQRALAAKSNLEDPTNFLEMEDILDFFETLAMLVRKRALDPYMVWHTFDYWIERYYTIAKPHIRARQQQEPGVWEDLSWLMPRLEKLQSKRGSSSATLSPQMLSAFLAEEAAEN
jgi:hypothetical protein